MDSPEATSVNRATPTRPSVDPDARVPQNDSRLPPGSVDRHQVEVDETTVDRRWLVALEREMATYQANLPNMLEHEGRYVVVQGDSLDGFWDTYDEALTVG